MKELTNDGHAIWDRLGWIVFALFLNAGINACELGVSYSRAATPAAERCLP